MHKKHSFIILLLGFLALSAYSYEIDQFTRRNNIPKDSLNVLDAEINLRINTALKTANTGLLGTSIGKNNCGGTIEEHKEARLRLFSELRSLLVNQSPVGLIENYAEKNSDIQKRKIELNDSIYSTAKEHSQILKKFGIGSVIQVAGTQIGADKLGHFFNEGYALYLLNHKQTDTKQRTKSILLSSNESEQNLFGISTTKVKSYGDLAANYDGSQFWNKLCGWPDNNMSETEKIYFNKNKCRSDAYLKCENGNWVKNPTQTLTLKNHITPAWDESINCSSFHEDISDLVFSQMSRKVFNYNGNPKQPCPAEPQKCFEIIQKYQARVAHGILNPICKKVADKIKKQEPINPNDKFSYTYSEFQKKSPVKNTEDLKNTNK